jgi:hypothetical protein
MCLPFGDYITKWQLLNDLPHPHTSPGVTFVDPRTLVQGPPET